MRNGLGWFALSSLLMLGITHAQTNKVTYVYTDFQGTPLAEADANGNIIATFDYRPYGSQTLGSPLTGPGYTGHMNDSNTGLIYMQARYYDADVARFLSIDPATPVAGNAFKLNRYTYANNNPMVNIDPDGRNSIIVLNSDGSININIPINFTGPAATTQNINAIKADAASKWSGLYNISGQITKVSVAVVDVNADTPKQAVNNIKLLNGPTSDKLSQGASFVRRGNSGEWDMTSNGMKVGESAHEVGHLMGDKDYYKDGTDANGARFTTPLSEYSNNLMGALNATVITDSRNMDLILSSPKNTVEYTPPPLPPPPQL